MGPATFCISIDKTYQDTLMPKKRSLIALLILAVSTLTVCCLESSRIYADTDAKFEAFTNTLFQEEVNSNSITLHYTLQNPDNYGISNPIISFGSYSVSSSDISTAAENNLAQLKDIPYAELSPSNQIIWKLLEDSFSNTLSGIPYLLYEEPISPLTGIQTQLPILLSEYQFADTTDVDTYLALLKTLPGHFDSLTGFETSKADAGLFMASSTADSVIKECNTFLNMGSSNYLYSSFEDRINNLSGCSADTKKAYIAQNESALNEYVFPTYQNLITALETLKSKSGSSGGLCRLPDGKNYYQHLVKCETGSDRSVAELKELTMTQIQSDLIAMQTILTSPEYASGTDSSNLSDTTFDAFTLQDSNPAAILNTLQQKTERFFPSIENVDTQVKYVQSDIAEYVSPAFYMVPAIDNTGGQTIYINSLHLPDDLTLFTTLAHEGFPGHLYQHVYYASTDPEPIRSLLDCGGYTEGWATYTEMISYYFSGLPKDEASLRQHNASVLLGLYALADIGIHYDGWNLKDTVSFFRDYSIQDAATISKIYDLITADPANYLKYYIGYVEFMELKKEAMKKWGDDFSQIRFHKAVLDAGPMPFYLLRTYVFDN